MGFTTIVITKPTFFEGEERAIERLLHEGVADLIHLRKPSSTEAQMEGLLKALPADLYGRLVLHDHFPLAQKYHLYGIHLNGRNPLPPLTWTGSVSRSCHSLDEVKAWKPQCQYVSLSPVFDSISKRGYLSAFTLADIAEAHNRGVIDRQVYALGGVTFSRINEVKAMGFGGALILGDAWK